MFVERRKHKRFKTEPDGVAVLTPPWPHCSLVGYISDISKGGVGFRYYADEQPLKPPFLLHFLASGTFYVLDIPFEPVWDFQMLNESPFIFAIRRCGVQFGEFTHEQISQVDSFIGNHTLAVR